MKKIVLYLTLVLLLFQCPPNEVEQSVEIINVPKTKQDASFEKLARIISSKMGDIVFKEFIKAEAVKPFDGDYDILLAEMVTKKYR